MNVLEPIDCSVRPGGRLPPAMLQVNVRPEMEVEKFEQREGSTNSNGAVGRIAGADEQPGRRGRLEAEGARVRTARGILRAQEETEAAGASRRTGQQAIGRERQPWREHVKPER